ncbi:hypothetical protein ACZ87_01027, partial [Candidatus Erwinia dacicola]
MAKTLSHGSSAAERLLIPTASSSKNVAPLQGERHGFAVP